MYNKKNLGVILIFSSIVLLVLFMALTTQRDRFGVTMDGAVKHDVESLFVGVHYFRLLDLVPNFELKSKSLVITNNNLFNFIDPRGVFLSKDSQTRYQANKGFLNQSTSNLELFGDVRLADEYSDYVSDTLKYDGKNEIIYANGNVSSQVIDKKTLDIIKLSSHKLTSYMAEKRVELMGSVKGRLIRKRRYETGFKFRAEEAEFNSPKSRLELAKSVKIYRNNYYLKAEKAEIFLENYNKKLKYYVLYDDVKLEEKLQLTNGKLQTRRAYSEKLEGHQRSGKIVLTGAPRVEQGRDVIKGYQITLHENVEMVEVDDSQSSFNLKRNRND
ncbi:MAG: LPS export ABC transporter periplasmic protein LptC [Halobacteriovoraceae bacterium]|jgi:lipopolysaccharide export system protein LptA|nr:LPS export ABC transporter periplasmic protein LptC [Halobacteriovoraceae bacterium]